VVTGAGRHAAGPFDLKQFLREAFNFTSTGLWHLNHARQRSIGRSVAVRC
jgi:hypothetical protein